MTRTSARTSRQTTENPQKAGPQLPFPEQSQPAPGSEEAMRPRPDFGLHSYRGYGRLEGRVALITGGDSGIGRAVALAFAREGADVAFTCLEAEEQDAEITAEAIEDAGRNALVILGDFEDRNFVPSVVKQTLDEFGRIDILVNNAASQGHSVESFEEIDADRLERTVRVNLMAPFLLIREALPHLKEGASIINVSSVQAYHPSPAIIDYSITKGALVTLTKGLATSLIDRGIRVNAVAPGPVWTPLIPQSFPADEVAHFGEAYPMKRPAQPAELAPAFVFLASDESRFVNGEILAVTGGRAIS